MPVSATLYREPRFATVNGRRMAYIDEGVGDPIVFQHGNPTSSYLWRTIMPHCEGLGRLIACDLIGMGRSDKLPDSRPERYSYSEQRDDLFALWDQLNLGNKVIMVLHDWGSLLGFDWTRQHPDRVQGMTWLRSNALTDRGGAPPPALPPYPSNDVGKAEGFACILFATSRARTRARGQ